MSVDLRRTYIGVSEKLLHSPQIGASLQQVGRIGVPERVWMQGPAVGEGIAGEHPPGIAGCHAIAAGIHEQGRRGLPDQPRPSIMQIRPHRVARRRTEREPPDLRALPEDRDALLAQIDIADVETAALTDAQTGAVEELEERGISRRARIVGVGRGNSVEHRDRIVAAGHARQLLRAAGRAQSRRVIA